MGRRLGAEVPVIVTSSATGAGLEELAGELLRRVAPRGLGGRGSGGGVDGPPGSASAYDRAPGDEGGGPGGAEDLRRVHGVPPGGREGLRRSSGPARARLR